jgi:hypothetical protein
LINTRVLRCERALREYDSVLGMDLPHGSWDSTLSLLTRARGGDEEELDELFGRYVPLLRRWAAGRLPRRIRDLADTPDLVQDTMLQVFKNIEGFEHRGEGAFHAYLADFKAAVAPEWTDELRPPVTLFSAGVGHRGGRGLTVWSAAENGEQEGSSAPRIETPFRSLRGLTPVRTRRTRPAIPTPLPW